MCFEHASGVAAFAAVRTFDDVTIMSEATARAFHRLKQEEESVLNEPFSDTHIQNLMGNMLGVNQVSSLCPCLQA